MSSTDRNQFEDTKKKNKKYVHNHEWELISILIDMKDFCKDQAVLVLDKCEGIDFIDFVKTYSYSK